MIKYIISDLNGVILHPEDGQNEKAISQIFSIPLDQAKNIWNTHKDNLAVGSESSWHLLQTIAEELNTPKPIDTLLKEWREKYTDMACDIDEELINFYDQLKHHYTLYMLTDTQDVHSQVDSQRGIYEPFEKVLTSNEEHIQKPDKKAFENLLNKTGAKADECVFIDDLDYNIRGAESVGLHGIVFQNLEQLKTDLAKLGVTVSK